MIRESLDVLTFDDLTVGDEWETPGRTVTETDVVLFAGISGDYNPLHCNHNMASKGPFGRPVAHGLLGLAIATGLLSTAPRIDTLAFLSILEWRFILPIAFGDTISVVSRVEALEVQARGRRGVVTWHRQIKNQDGRVVQEGKTQTLVRGRTQTPTSQTNMSETDQ
ncbi:MAG: MaoC/PaaZ C-terminal domain-containing protein [Isosphaeraceae bacterium]